MAKKEKKIPEYVQAFVPDIEELAALVYAAKGANRSMAEFSRVCKAKGPSTFSRIVNQLIDKPLSDELLIAIAENAADPHEVTLDRLMRANGKIPKGEFSEEEPTNSMLKNRKLFRGQSEKNKKIKDILVQHYLGHGHPVIIHPDLALFDKIPSSRYGLQLPSDFALHVEGIDPLYWNFIVDFTDLHDVSLKSAKFDFGAAFSRSMKKYSPLFLRDAWEPETLKDFKNTIIFTEEKAYVSFRILLKDAKVNNCISAMLIDDTDGYMDLEYHLTRK